MDAFARILTSTLINNKSNLTFSSSGLLALVPKLRASTPMVDEPIANLRHADTSRLKPSVNKPAVKDALAYSRLKTSPFALRLGMDSQCSVIV